jgi:hypothetical protein
MDLNEVFTRLRCLSCESCQRDKVLAKLGAYYLLALDGHPVPPPPLDEMLKGCCQVAIQPIATYLQPDLRERMRWEEQAAGKTHHKRWRW